MTGSNLFGTIDDGRLPNRDPKRIGAADELIILSSFEFSDDKVNGRQHDFGIDYTISQNASLCASFLVIFCYVNLDVSTPNNCRPRFPSPNFSRTNQSQTYQIHSIGAFVPAASSADVSVYTVFTFTNVGLLVLTKTHRKLS